MAGTRTMGSTLTLKQAGNETEDMVVASLTSIGEITGDSEEIDVTTLDSPNGAKEYISGATDWGTTDIAGNVTDTTQVAALRALHSSKTIREWVITTPAGNTQTFSAFVKTFGYGEKTVDGLDTYKMTLRVTGEPTYAAAAA